MSFLLKYKTEIIKYLLIMVSVLGGYYALANYHQGVGFDKAVMEISRESADKIAKATSDALKNTEIEIDKALKKQRLLFDADLKKAKEDREVEIQIREVINDVEKIKYVNNCGKLNTDSIRLLNEAIDHVNRTP